MSKVRWEKDGGRENLEVDRKERRERRENRSGSINSPSLVSILFSLFPKGNLVATHPALPSHLALKQDCSVWVVIAIRVIFCTVNYFIIGFNLKPHRETYLSPVPSMAFPVVLRFPPRGTSWVILLQEDTTQLDFRRQMKCFVFLSFFGPLLCATLLCL